MRILIVDDSEMMRRILKLAFQTYADDREYEVVEAKDGREAWDSIVGDGVPDIILLDWNMPVLDGMAFIKMVRNSGYSTPVIMVSSRTDEQQIHEAFRAGVNAYLKKPVQVADVWQQVREFMP